MKSVKSSLSLGVVVSFRVLKAQQVNWPHLALNYLSLTGARIYHIDFEYCLVSFEHHSLIEGEVIV